MKVLIIGFTKLVYMPYMNFYIQQLQKLSCDLTLLYWNRDSVPDIETPAGVYTYCYERHISDNDKLVKKLPRFLGFRNYALKILGRNEYDLIVVLHSTPGVLLSDILINKFKGRYILDYRDFTYENIRIYKKIIHNLIQNSIRTFVSSRGYFKFLPNSPKLVISHNTSEYDAMHRSVRKYASRESFPIRIRYWGLIRHVVINKKIIDKLGNDSRFELHYHGREQELGQQLKEYVEENRFTNIFFHGEYKPKDKAIFSANTDLIHNMYENDTKTTYAMGNKFYDGINFYIPQLCNMGSFMGQEAELNRVGIMLDPSEVNFADMIYEYYRSIDWEVFISSCDDKMKSIVEESNRGIHIIKNIVTNKEYNLEN